MTPCDLLSMREHPNLPMIDLMADQLGNKELLQFLQTIRNWVGGIPTGQTEKHDKTSSEIFKYVDKCPTRSGWNRYTGKVYRGLYKIGDIFRSKVVTDGLRVVRSKTAVGDQAVLICKYQYESSIKAQSWTRTYHTGYDFSQSRFNRMDRDNVGFILEKTIGANDGLRMDWLGGLKHEDEIIVRVKSETLRCIVPLYDYSRNSIRRTMNKPAWAYVPEDIAKLIPTGSWPGSSGSL